SRAAATSAWSRRGRRSSSGTSGSASCREDRSGRLSGFKRRGDHAVRTRREFLGAAGAGLVLGAGATTAQAQAQAPGRKKMAVITTHWRVGSHAWHMAERFLVGYPRQGAWHQPP